jgi:metal-responsive CopG/Arc/MetJ family transcriptional regulator
VSPRQGPRRPIVGVRIKAEDIDEIDTLATTEGVTRSEMIRVLISEALAARSRRKA